MQFTPEQKANIVNQIETDRKSDSTLGAAIQKHDIYVSLYSKWKHQLAVKIHFSFRSNKAPADTEKKQLKIEVQKNRTMAARKIKDLCSGGLASLNLPLNWSIKPEIRVDR